MSDGAAFRYCFAAAILTRPTKVFAMVYAESADEMAVDAFFYWPIARLGVGIAC